VAATASEASLREVSDWVLAVHAETGSSATARPIMEWRSPNSYHVARAWPSCLWAFVAGTLRSRSPVDT
jgi:hypothetical protein